MSIFDGRMDPRSGPLDGTMRLGSARRPVDQERQRRFTSYLDYGFDASEAGALAEAGDVPPEHVRRVAERKRLNQRLELLADLDVDEARAKWDTFDKETRTKLVELNPDLAMFQPAKQSGLFGVPYLGDAISGVARGVGAAAEGINDVTAGYAGKAIGSSLEFMNEAAEKIVQQPYRTLSGNIRERGWVSGVWHGLRGYDYDKARDGENTFKPGTLDELRERFGMGEWKEDPGDDTLISMARMVSRGWDDTQILTTIGLQEGTDAWATEFAALQELKHDDTFRGMLDFLEQHKISPGRDLATLFNDNRTVSGITDGTWRMITDPTMMLGSAARVARISRYVRFDDAAQFSEKFDEVFGSVDQLVAARTARTADGGFINPLSDDYFRQLRTLDGYSREQLEVVLFMDHMLAGTRAGAGRRIVDDAGELVATQAAPEWDRVDEVLGQYQRLRPQNTIMVDDMAELIAKGEVFDEVSMAAAMRDGVLLNGLKAGMGQPRITAGVPGIFVPRMPRWGTQRMQAKLVLNKAIDWSKESTFAFKAGEQLRPEDLASAKVFLSETMRRNRGETGNALDDFSSFHAAIRDKGFDQAEIANLMQRRFVDELGGTVIEGELPIYALARAVTREGRINRELTEKVEVALRGVYPDDADAGQQLVDAFLTQADSYWTRFREMPELSYADTLLDDAELDQNVERLVAGFDDGYRSYLAKTEDARQRALESGLPGVIAPMTRREFFDEQFQGGFFNPARADHVLDEADPRYAISEFRRSLRDTQFTLRTPQGQRLAISKPDEYLGLIDEIGHAAIARRLDEADELAPLLERDAFESMLNVGKLSTYKNLARHVGRPFASIFRMMPRHGYIDFGSEQGIDELRRWLDLGVYGSDANRLLGEFINAGTDAQKRSVLFAAQREILKSTGILFNEAHQSFVDDILAATQQFYGGGLMLDGAGHWRQMALFPQAHSASMMRVTDGREILAHMQRTRFMEMFSPRFGKVSHFVQGVNRYWKPMAVLSPRLILRAGLDEMLTIPGKHGLVGNQGLVPRYLREWTVRAQQRRFMDAVNLRNLDPSTLTRLDIQLGEAGVKRTYRGVLDEIDKARSSIKGGRITSDDIHAEGGGVLTDLARINHSMIERGLLDDNRRLWELPEKELQQVMDEADAANMFASYRPILEDDAPHIIESARITERMADGLINRMAQWLDIDDAHMRAAMAMAVDPAIARSLRMDLTHVGVSINAQSDNGQDLGEYALRGDAEELGHLQLEDIRGGERAVKSADTNDELGRLGVVRTYQQAQADDFIRDVVAPIARMELPPSVRRDLDPEIREALPWLADVKSRNIPTGDPVAAEVVDGVLAPVMARAAADDDPVLAARATFLTLPDELQDIVWSELDRSIPGKAHLRNRWDTDTGKAELYDAYLAKLGQLQITEGSALHLSQDQFVTFIDQLHLARPRHAWAIAVNDAPLRPGATADAITRLRIGSDGTFYARPSETAGRNVDQLLDGDVNGLLGPGLRLQTADSIGRVPVADGYQLTGDGRIINLALRLDDDTSAIFRGAFDALDEKLANVGTDQADQIRAAFAVPDVTNESVRDFLAELPQRIGMVRAAHGDEPARYIAQAVDNSLYGALSANGRVGFIADRTLASSLGVDDVKRVAGGRDLTIFDRKAFAHTKAAAAGPQANYELGLTGRLETQIDQWVDALQGRPWEDIPLVHDRKVEYLTRTDYWRNMRGHDLMGADNGVASVPNADQVILHVPRRIGERPELPSTSMYDDLARKIPDEVYGSTDPDLAATYLDNLARSVGDDPKQWVLTEVRIPRRSIANRRVTPGALDQLMAPPGMGAEAATALHTRANDQLLRISRRELDASPLMPATRDERLVLAISDRLPLAIEDAVGRLQPAMVGAAEVSSSRALFDTLNPMTVVADDPDLAVELGLLKLLDTVGEDALNRSMVGADGAPRAFRAHAEALADATGTRPDDWQGLALVAQQQRTVPAWWRFGIDEMSVQLTKGKRVSKAADDFVDEFDRNARSMFNDSHEGAPLYELLGPVERKTFRASHVADYYGPLPSRVIRPKVKPVDERNRFWRFTDKGFEFISHGIAELSRYPMFVDNFAVALDDVRKFRRPTARHAQREAEYREIFGDRFDDLMLRFENDMTAAIAGDDTATLVSELDKDLVERFVAYYGPLPASKLDDFTQYLDAELAYRQVERRDALVRAMHEVTPYIDDHRVRSQFASAIDEVVPFFYATEQFIKRWARTVHHSPEVFRRLQLYYHGFEAHGTVTEDENGEDVFAYPMTGFLTKSMTQVFNAMGLTDAMVPGVNFTGRTQDILPGLHDPLRLGAGPVAMLPLWAMRPFFPEEVAMFEESLGGERAKGRDLWDIFLPSALTRFRGLEPWGDDKLNSRDAVAMMAYFEANHPELVPGGKLDENGEPIQATEQEISEYMDRIRHGSRMLALARGMYGLAGPASPRLELDTEHLNKEFVDLLDAGLPIEQAIGEFLANHPNGTAYTIFATESVSGAPTTATETMLAAVDANPEFFDTYGRAGPWLLPYDATGDEPYSNAAQAELMALGYRDRKNGEEWYQDFKFAQGAALYFPSRDAKDAALAAAGSNTMRKDQIRQMWRQWTGEFQRRHPVFMQQFLSQEGTTKRAELRDQMRVALADPLLPVEAHTPVIAELMSSWDRLEQLLDDHISYSLDQRREFAQGFHRWARQLTAGDFMTTAFYERAMLRDIDIATDYDAQVMESLGGAA